MCLKDIFDEPKKNKIKKVNMWECTQITIDWYSIIIPNDMVDKVVNILTN